MNHPPQHGQGRGQQGLGPTWYPGGQDDFYMPEVISPSPQRVMPEVPENMQDNIAQMEHHSYDPRRAQPQSPAQYAPRSQFPERSSSAVQSQPQQAQAHDHGAYAQSATYDSMDHPNFSPFPREANLERARMAVLSTTDPEMQLAWAQDALAFVEVAAQNEARLSTTQPPRPHTPQVERQLRTDAMNIVNFLAGQQHPKAEFIKGMWLEFGKFGYRIDRKEAFRSYTRAAEKGYARAEYRIGMQFESSGEPEKAIRHYERGVSMSDSASYYRLGMMILLGQHGQRQDYRRGLEYIRLAAQSCDQNAPQGAYVYGMLLAGELPQVSVPEPYLTPDLNIARVNIEKAAYHGFAKAQVKMGAAYELCQLQCDFNPALSLHYNALAARQGEPEAEMAISKWFLCGHEGVFEKNDELAFTYAQRAAQSGLPTAEFALGYFYEVGIFVPVDIREARSWYAKSAASGNKDASSRIDSISRSKTLSRKDHEKVAISRIKSTRYAHQRGNSLEATPENIEMPDPSRMSLNDQPPSAAPYPDRTGSARPRPPEWSSPGPGYGGGRNPSYGAGGPGGPPGPMNYRQHSPGGLSGPTSPQSAGMISPSGTPRVDIGYSAPVPPPGADRRRPARLDSAPPDRKPVRTPVSGHAPAPGPLPSPRNPTSPRPMGSPQSANFPPRNESRQPSRSSASSTPQPPAGPAQQQQPAKPAAPPPSKGPKTFEEMGVPSAKNDSDCFVVCRGFNFGVVCDLSLLIFNFHLNFHLEFESTPGFPQTVTAMAPRKEKGDKGARTDDATLVLDYLREQNRPYSAIDISANLHNKVTKTQAAKVLKELHQNGEIEGRTAGKQIVYHALQKASDSASPEVLVALSQQITTLQDELSTIKANEKKARAALSALEAKPRLSTLREDIRQLQEERDAAQARIGKLYGDDQPQISPEARAQLERDWKQWQRQATVRRGICRELWGRCSEVLPEDTTAPELWVSHTLLLIATGT
ncbi:Chitin synthase activator (Chs3) [Penicillium cataractarum]|uniref:Chitin synthase activator (Chs3) n=1 Tax=Penicillium cataractarum TaxID=2100454 RepID=A0A9W9SGZ3_9EURO|nr:Chitin synthase activator (Chs3) [Penicillium cataractarum]KAJ5377865.1 Chitin synthase activator (Chs3) [Penicillium cataractarum]